MMRASRSVLLVVLAGASSCGGGQAPSEPTPPPGQNTPRITITSAGVSVTELVVPPGTAVLFVNSDSRAHFMASDPHPDHQECPAINLVGLLRPGENRSTGNLVQPRTCGFHDHDDPTNVSLQGRIVTR